MKEAVVIPADAPAYRLKVPSDGESELVVLQKLVGGYVELVSHEYFTIFCNEEGKIDQLPWNWRGTHLFAPDDDVIAGTMVVLGPGDGNGETLGLDEEEAEAVLQSVLAITDADCERWSRWHHLRMRESLATTDEEREALAIEREELTDWSLSQLYRQDLGNEDQWWWLSFADGDLPEGEQFLGVAIVRGGGVMEATINARARGCNPGGEVRATPIPEDKVPDEEYLNRLMSAEELKEAGLA